MFVACICTSNNNFFFHFNKMHLQDICSRRAHIMLIKNYRSLHVHTTCASKHAHAAEPQRPAGQPAPVAGVVIAQEMELVGQRTRDNEAAALALMRTLGAAAGVPLLGRRRPLPRSMMMMRRRRRAAGGGHEVVVHRPSRCPALLDRAKDERDEPLHPHFSATSRAASGSSLEV